VMGKLKEAEKEYSIAIDREPKHSASYYHRAIARYHLGRFEDAAADATRALELGEPAFRTFHLRASIRAGRKPEEAASDLAAAAKLEPQDEADYVARGRSKLSKDPAGALADYAKATELNPRYLSAWQNSAHVLAERLDQPDRSLDMLDKAVAVNPGFAPALAGRAVIHARLGKRDDALRSAEAALKQSDDSLIRFQVACTYALSAKANPDDARAALDHLRKALRDGYADFANIAKDSDLDGIRELKEFKTIVDSAKELYAK
jgi:tetratricopeptide (TPR) repeat protein